MKKYAAFIYSLVLISFFACGNADRRGTSNEDTAVEEGVEITPLEIHEVMKLDENGAESPALTIDISLSTIKAKEKEATDNINQAIAYTLFESDSSDIKGACIEFIANCKNEYMEMKPDYINSRSDAPWFNNYYNMSCEVETGYKGILNYVIFNEVYTGGAHPNSYYTALNFDTSTGKEVVLQEIFKDDWETRVTQELVVELANHFKVEPVTEVVVRGYLINDFYISNNFILGKDKITFIYNRYDIAPYAAGEIMLDIEYNRLKDVLK